MLPSTDMTAREAEASKHSRSARLSEGSSAELGRLGPCGYGLWGWRRGGAVVVVVLVVVVVVLVVVVLLGMLVLPLRFTQTLPRSLPESSD